MRRPPLALSLGDPAGIGPEIVVKAWQALRETGPAFLVVGDLQSLASASPRGSSILRRVTRPGEAPDLFADALPVLDLPLQGPVVSGRADPAYGPAVIRWIETAAGLALSGEVSGVVTAPIAKAPLYAAGFRHPGHTEFLAELTAVKGRNQPVMMLSAGGLRTVLATIHIPIDAVAGALSLQHIVDVGRITAQALKDDFGVAHPRLAMAALNPHGGETGTLGREEIGIIAPAAKALRALGVDCGDPKPADTLFHPEARARYDAVICMYHDQALIPVKMLDFWGGVNVTLGLPIVRTSPDHGVGFDIAGRGLARADSLIAAIRLAGEIAGRRQGDGQGGVRMNELPPLRDQLEAHGLFARKSFGQHFLLDLNLTRKIARLAGPLEGCAVLEAGPGPGGLTRALLEAGARVVAIEKDDRFQPLLAELAQAADGALSVVGDDALTSDDAALLAKHAPGLPCRIVSNLPYNVGTALLIKWLTGPLRPQAMALMFQKEVAQRIIAGAGEDAYGRLSVIVQAICRAQIVMDLPARAFTPPPKVDSAVVLLTPLVDRPSEARLDALERVTAAAFGQRRKMLRSSLKSLGGETLCVAAEIDPQSRAEEIPVEGFLALAARLQLERP